MKKIILFLLLSLLVCCSISSYEPYVSYNDSKKETLIRLESKIIWQGSISFLRYDNGQYQLLVYSYYLNKKYQSASCTLRKIEKYSPEEVSEHNIDKNWQTSSLFKHGLNLDPYFTWFSPDFLELSNDDKIKVLNELSEKGNSILITE